MNGAIYGLEYKQETSKFRIISSLLETMSIKTLVYMKRYKIHSDILGYHLLFLEHTVCFE